MATNFTGDFNVDPYYDDFDAAKNYHRILFKPGFAVQARELTQSQTILQNQITSFADAIFAQNTPISGGKVTVNQNVYYLKLNTTVGSTTISAENFADGTITNADSSVVAKVVYAAEATTTSSGAAGDSPTLIVSYITGSRFVSGDTIYLVGSNFTATLITSTVTNLATGLSSVASISDGIFYVKGNFVTVSETTIPLEKYSSTPSLRVGLNASESIYNYTDDSSLLDPALNASNYQAPGADRYKITLTLETRPLELGNDNNFIELVRLESGSILKQVNETVYSTIDDYIAKRTRDTNGDFIVKDYTLTPKSNTGYAAEYNLGISKGIAYVRGYRLETQSDVTLTNDRARTTSAANNNPTYIDYGNYFYVNSANGVFDVSTLPAVDFHSVVKSNVNTANATTYNSTLAGTGYIRNLIFSSTTNTANGDAYIYKAYVFGLQNQVLSNTVISTSANNNYITLPYNNQFSANANAYYGVTVTIDQGTSAGDSRKIVDYSVSPSAKIAFVDTPFTVTPDATSVFSLRFDVTDYESIIVSTSGTPYTITANAAIDNSSKIDSISTGDAVLQNQNNPELLFNLGNRYVSTVTDTSYETVQVFRNVAFTVSGGNISAALTFGSAPVNTLSFPFGNGTISADAVTQNFQIIVTNPQSSGLRAGQCLPWTTGTRTVTISGSGSTATFTTPTSDLGAFTATIIAKAYVRNGNDTSFVLKAKNLKTTDNAAVHITGTSVATYTKVDLTYAQVYVQNAGLVTAGQPQKLYITDVKRIVKIIDTKSAATAATNAMLTDTSFDVTSRFTFDNGQRDSYYDFATITLKIGQTPIQGNMLVLLDYYETTGGDGYYSVGSYLTPVSSSPENYAEIPSYTSTSGTTYQLRDALDFRPALINAQANFTIRTSSSGSGAAGAYMPVDLSTFVSDYTNYLGRYDKLVFSKDREFEIIQGTPSDNPLLPGEPDGALVVANLFHDPYTAYIPSEVTTGILPNLSIEKVKHKRWLMSDITGLESRVNNLEYYTALNLLEKNAASLQIPDINGLNRFKNGILVDDFSGYSTSDTNNLDYLVTVNRRTKQLTASQNVSNFPLQSLSLVYNMGQIDSTSANNLNYKISKSGASNFYTLPYTTSNVVTQPIASRTVNLNPFAVALKEGIVTLSPPMDNWVDIQKSPDLLIVDPNLQVYRASDNLNVLQVGDWKTTVATTTVATIASGRNWFTNQVTNYIQEQQDTVLGYYDKLNSSYVETAGYIQDVSVLPYIRQQFVFFNSYGMLVNTSVNAYFDNVEVNKYIRKPNILELTSVTGTFTDGDVIGYYAGGNFTPIAKILSYYNYPGTTNARLYVIGDIVNTNFNAGTTIQNAQFNTSGQYQTSTASGVISAYTHLGGVITNANTTTTITLSPLASNTTNFYAGNTLYVINGTGVGQSATINSYNGTTKLATLGSSITAANGDIYSIGTLKTNEVGMVSGVFSIPGGTFNTGERSFRVDNRIANNLDTATTYSEARFFASGLQATKQGLNYASSIDAAKNTFVSTATKENTTSYNYTVVWDPVAQTFIVDKENYPNGIFVDSVKLFFKTKPTTGFAPVTLSIVGTLNGYPNGETLDNSQVVLTSEHINISDEPHYLDPNTYTVFKFPAPVYLEANKLYAFIVKCPTSNEYTIYTAQLGDNAIASSTKNLPTDSTPTTVTKINSAPYVGALFVSQNLQTWTADQNEAMMFVMNRCVFSKTVTPTLQFVVPNRLPYRKVVENDINYYLNPNTISSKIVTSANTNVPIHALNISTTDFLPGSTTLNYQYVATLNTSFTAAATAGITPGKYGTPTYDDIYLNDGFGERVLVANSNTSFSLYAAMSTVDDAVSPMISDDGLSVYTIRWSINNLELSNSMISVANTGGGYDPSTLSVTITANGFGSGAVAVANVTAQGNIDSIFITTAGSGYATTPIITVSDPTTRSGNANVVVTIAGETSKSGGNGVAKYITKKVVLDQGFDSGDLRVYFTAYRPVNTNIYVYYKILSRSDTQLFNDGNWQLMTLTNSGDSKFSQNRNNLYEYIAAPGSGGTAQNYVSYTSTVNGQTYNRFSQFAIKVVLTTSDKTAVPFLTDIRAIALPAIG